MNLSRRPGPMWTKDGAGRLGTALILAVTVVACASNRPAPKSAAESTESKPAAAGQYPSQPTGGTAGYPQQAQPTQPSQPSTVAPEYAPPPPPTQPGKATESEPSREFDHAERELSVAAGDCGTACRALSSMDRAAGNICKLSSDRPRCDEVTKKVRTARTKVKNSCGECKETSTNPNDSVPSR